MRKYQMRVYGSGRPEPRLLQTHDIFADSDALARAMAWRQYDKLIRELADQGAQPIWALRASALHFTLSEGDRIVFERVPANMMRGEAEFPAHMSQRR